MPNPFRSSDVREVTISEGIVTIRLISDPDDKLARPRHDDYTLDAARVLYTKLANALTRDGFKDEQLIELGQMFQDHIENARLREATRLLRLVSRGPLSGAEEDQLREQAKVFLGEKVAS
jgi:hypothetical protein